MPPNPEISLKSHSGVIFFFFVDKFHFSLTSTPHSNSKHTQNHLFIRASDYMYYMWVCFNNLISAHVVTSVKRKGERSTMLFLGGGGACNWTVAWCSLLKCKPEKPLGVSTEDRISERYVCV